jgi:hypothetical protein
MSRTKVGFLDNLASAVRENPLAAALIGGGAFWLLTGTERLKAAANSATAAASPLAEIGARNVRAAASDLQRTMAPPTAPEMDNGGSFHVGDSLRDTAGAAADAVSGAADKIKSGIDEATEVAREKIGKAQSTLADVFERQPLVIGLVGLAIGAAVAGAVRGSNLENEWLGELSDDVKADLSARAGAVSQSVRQASDTLKSELGDAGAEAVDRLRQAGADAANAASQTVKSS